MSTPSMGQPSGPDSSSKGWLTPRTIGIALLVLISLTFVFENTQRVKVRFLIPKFGAPLWLALVVAFALGAVCGLILARRRGRRSSD